MRFSQNILIEGGIMNIEKRLEKLERELSRNKQYNRLLLD